MSKEKQIKNVKQETIITTCDFCSIKQIGHMSQCSVCGKDICYRHAMGFNSERDDDQFSRHVGCPDHKELIQRAYDERERLIYEVPTVDQIIERLKNEEA